MSRRASRAVATTACLVAAVVTAAVPLVAGGAPVRPQLTLALAGFVVLLLGLAGWAPGITLAALALATEYALRLHERRAIDGLVVIEAAVLFATVELGQRALEARSYARPEPEVRRAALGRLALMITGACACAFVVLVLGSRKLPAPTAGLALGLAAAAGVIVAAELVRRSVTRPG
jgi:hypothetical protein